MKQYWWIALVLTFFGGWAAGQMWERPEDYKNWKRKEKEYQLGLTEYAEHQKQWDIDRGRIIADRDTIKAQRDSAMKMAQLLLTTGNNYKRKADSLQRLQQSDTSATLQVRLDRCQLAFEYRTNEANNCHTEAERLRVAIAKDSIDKAKSDSLLDVERKAHQATKDRLAEADTVIVGVVKPKGCGLPLCLAFSITYEPWMKRVDAQATLPVKWPWLRVGAARDLSSHR